MFETLPTKYDAVKDWTWDDYAPYAQDLMNRELNDESAGAWLRDHTRLSQLLNESYTRLQVAHTRDTTDKAVEEKYFAFLDTMLPEMMKFENDVNQKIALSGIQPEGFEIILRNIQADIEIFREENLPLITELQKLTTEYDKISGAQTIEWEGKEITIQQTAPILKDTDRGKREQVWWLASDRQLADRDKLNALWRELLPLRRKVAANANLPDFRAYTWKSYHRFDYTPEDCALFHEAIEQVVVPAAERLYEKRRQQLGVDVLRPWDLSVDALGRLPLRPYEDIKALPEKMSAIYHKVDPQLGGYFDAMRQNELLDLDNRKGKAPGGYCTEFAIEHVPFIFMNAVGVHDDVQTLLHEGGHAFHVFETKKLPYVQQRDHPIEFAEVASMSMELLGAPYLVASEGGYYSEADAARARIEHLETSVCFWPYMAVVDAFQQWVYTHPDDAENPANCDSKWGELYARFMKGVDWSGLEDARVTGWHRKLHIFHIPFYYVEYGLAQLGAMQVWARSLENQQEAIADYRRALSLGYTASLPDLFAAAGAKFAFDADTMHAAVDLMMRTIDELEAV